MPVFVISVDHLLRAYVSVFLLHVGLQRGLEPGLTPSQWGTWQELTVSICSRQIRFALLAFRSRTLPVFWPYLQVKVDRKALKAEILKALVQLY